MKKELILCLAMVPAFAFKPFDTNPHSMRMGVHSVSIDDKMHHGFSMNYEKLSPSSMYVGSDLSAVTSKSFSTSRFELRMGYTPEKVSETIVSPFLSLGSIAKKETHYAQEDFSTFGVGCNFNMIANAYFSVGAGVQALRVKSFKNTNDEEFYGWEVHYGMKFFPETMDVELKPYFMKMNNLAREKHLGLKVSVGYAF